MSPTYRNNDTQSKLKKEQEEATERRKELKKKSSDGVKKKQEIIKEAKESVSKTERKGITTQEKEEIQEKGAAERAKARINTRKLNVPSLEKPEFGKKNTAQKQISVAPKVVEAESKSTNSVLNNEGHEENYVSNTVIEESSQEIEQVDTLVAEDLSPQIQKEEELEQNYENEIFEPVEVEPITQEANFSSQASEQYEDDFETVEEVEKQLEDQEYADDFEELEEEPEQKLSNAVKLEEQKIEEQKIVEDTQIPKVTETNQVEGEKSSSLSSLADLPHVWKPVYQGPEVENAEDSISEEEFDKELTEALERNDVPKSKLEITEEKFQENAGLVEVPEKKDGLDNESSAEEEKGALGLQKEVEEEEVEEIAEENDLEFEDVEEENELDKDLVQNSEAINTNAVEENNSVTDNKEEETSKFVQDVNRVFANLHDYVEEIDKHIEGNDPKKNEPSPEEKKKGEANQFANNIAGALKGEIKFGQNRQQVFADFSEILSDDKISSEEKLAKLKTFFEDTERGFDKDTSLTFLKNAVFGVVESANANVNAAEKLDFLKRGAAQMSYLGEENQDTIQGSEQKDQEVKNIAAAYVGLMSYLGQGSEQKDQEVKNIAAAHVGLKDDQNFGAVVEESYKGIFAEAVNKVAQPVIEQQNQKNNPQNKPNAEEQQKQDEENKKAEEEKAKAEEVDIGQKEKKKKSGAAEFVDQLQASDVAKGSLALAALVSIAVVCPVLLPFAIAGVAAALHFTGSKEESRHEEKEGSNVKAEKKQPPRFNLGDHAKKSSEQEPSENETVFSEVAEGMEKELKSEEEKLGGLKEELQKKDLEVEKELKENGQGKDSQESGKVGEEKELENNKSNDSNNNEPQKVIETEVRTGDPQKENLGSQENGSNHVEKMPSSVRDQLKEALNGLQKNDTGIHDDFRNNNQLPDNPQGKDISQGA